MSENQSKEQQIYDQFIEKLKSGDDAAAKDILVGRVPEGADYAGEEFLTYLTDECDPMLVLFLSIHYGCESVFNLLKKQLELVAVKDGYNPCIAQTIYFLMQEQLTNLNDPQFAEQVARGEVHDLWPCEHAPHDFCYPCRQTGDVEVELDALNFSSLRDSTSLKEGNLEFDGSGFVSSGLHTEYERLSPEEWGDRSRVSGDITVVYSLET